MSAHTPTPWSYEEWATSGPTAAAAMTIEQSMRLNEFAVPMTRVCQAMGTGKQVVAIALGNTQEESDGNAALIVAATNACAGMSDPEAEIARLKGLDAIPERWTPDMTQGVFNKDALAYEIGRVFGEHGAHAEVLQALIRERDALRAERDGLAKCLDYCLQWIASSSEAQDWNSRTTPDFVVQSLAALADLARSAKS